MGDKLDELFKILGNNKKGLKTALVIYIFVTIAVIIFIWMPKKSDRIKYDVVNMDEKRQELVTYYYNEISKKFKNGDKISISNSLSEDYLLYIGKTNEQLISQLEKEGFFSTGISVENMTLYEDKGTYVYTTQIETSSGTNKKINLIEKSPYEYIIAFDNFYSYNDDENSITKENIQFTISSEYRNFEYIKYGIRIENKDNVYCSFDFNNITGVQAVLEDGTKFALSNLVSTEENTKISKNTTINKQFVFEIPVQLQNSIEYIVFNNVKIDTSTVNIKIEI